MYSPSTSSLPCIARRHTLIQRAVAMLTWPGSIEIASSSHHDGSLMQAPAIYDESPQTWPKGGETMSLGDDLAHRTASSMAFGFVHAINRHELTSALRTHSTVLRGVGTLAGVVSVGADSIYYGTTPTKRFPAFSPGLPGNGPSAVAPVPHPCGVRCLGHCDRCNWTESMDYRATPSLAACFPQSPLLRLHLPDASTHERNTRFICLGCTALAPPWLWD